MVTHRASDGAAEGGVRPTPVAREPHETLQGPTDWAEHNRVYIAESRATYDAEHQPELLDA